MLQQMFSPLSAHAGEVATIPRPLEGRVCGDASSEASSDATEDVELPACKIRRNYNCPKCTFYTQNPRVYLVHTRDVHFERIKIYDCPNCVYASRHHQKLLRHIKMVHGSSSTSAVPPSKIDLEPTSTTTDSGEPLLEREEDLLEEVEDSNDAHDVEALDYQEEQFEQSMEVDDERSTNDELTAPEMVKNKSKFFSCNKCNYVTHLRARYTKHVKYHSMPMIKCTLCDFRTPYKWNLDRHMKNHGGGGNFCCSMCNFTADIKQSLTVHEMNHHTPPMGQSPASRRRNRVGASDVFADDAAALIAKEDEGSGDSRSSHSMPDFSQYTEMTEVLNYNNDSNDASANDSSNKDDCKQSSNNVDQTKSASRKKPRPIPQLIPLNVPTPSPSKLSTYEPPKKKFKGLATHKTDSDNHDKFDKIPVNVTMFPVSAGAPIKNDNPPKKKNESFFDKLKERLLTETGKEGSLVCKNCGFQSKCLSEQSVHEKNCSLHSNRVVTNSSMASTGSTRCQNCRHRCKSSADLYVHMQTCTISNKNANEQVAETKSNSNEVATFNTDRDSEPHPMENVVFVWNNIERESGKFDTPLDISINDDSTLPSDAGRSYDPNNVDALHDNEGMNLSPTQTIGKKVYKCPHCPFWASTASRFHVHIVGHLNKKPFECSLCQYKSNWRWDITKHIKLKSARDPEHNDAKVLMTDETGRRNYSKYNKFLAMLTLNENGENDFQYIDANSESVNTAIEVDDSLNESGVFCDNAPLNMLPLDLQTHQQNNTNMGDNKEEDPKKPKKTLWKCKKCNYKDPSKEALLEHVREHSKIQDGSQEDPQCAKKGEALRDPGDLAYRCGHCNQLSNWKHVIQRHCRLKHDGVIKVIATERPKFDQTPTSVTDINNDYCTKCPYKTNDKKQLLVHMQQHTPSPQSIFKCYFCQYYVKTEQELQQHLSLHSMNDQEEYVAKAMECKEETTMSPVEQIITTKRHKCIECPYETNSKSQFMYHEQFHRLPADTPYKCQECNYSVSKRHLLHQHMRVHGIIVQKKDHEFEPEPMSTPPTRIYSKPDLFPEDIPYVWVSAKNEFHKMFKCRYCSYVNSQKCKIPNHEKIHCILFENSDITVYKCLECKFTCDSAFRLAKHSKTHSEIYGRIYFAVEIDVPDEEQIAKLRELIEDEKKAAIEGLNNKDDVSMRFNEDKLLFFCQKCPTRFFAESELKVHEKFHDLIFGNKCKSCEFSVPQENQLAAHVYVHTDGYQAKTKMLKIVHDTHPNHKEPIIERVFCPTASELTWVVSTKNTTHDTSAYIHKKNNDIKQMPKQFSCKLCPAKFLKNSALSYHMGLHGGEGDHKCKKCSYTVKNIGNLAKHELLHEDENRTSNNCDYESGDDVDFKNVPLSGTDLFQRKTEAQKRVFTDKDKLVKPNDHFPPVLQADPQFGYLMHGNPEFIYPTYLKNGRQKEKRYKCHKCPSAFEKREQYKIHLSLHGSKQRYKCELCDYSVKYYANYVQHMRKHQMNDEAQAERKKETEFGESEIQENSQEDSTDNIKLAIKTMPRGLPKSDFQQFSVSDQQTLRLLQRRRSINSAIKDATTPETPVTKDRKLHLCVFCPYSNQRQDALSNHYRRHDNKDILNLGNHKCSHCDLTVVQSHFLREHMKTHFNYQKTTQPQCYAANDDVVFTITKIEEETSSKDLSLIEGKGNKFEICKPTADKIYVQMATGEIVVE